VELFEFIRKECFILGKGIRQIAREQKIHCRQIRQAIESALPPLRKISVRKDLIVTESMQFAIDSWLTLNQKAPKKQRHTSFRIFKRLVDEFQYKGSESHLRKVVSRRRRKLHLIFVISLPVLP